MKKALSLVLALMIVFSLFSSLTLFVSAEEAADEPVIVSISGYWKSAAYNFCDITHGEDGLMTFGHNSQDVPIENMIYIFNNELDLYDVDYIRFHFKNDTGYPITFTNIGAKAAITTNNNENIVDNDLDFWNGYPGYVYIINGHDFNECPVYVKADGDADWSLPSKESVGPDPALFTIDVGFDGWVKLPLTLHDRSYDDGTHRISKGIGLCMMTGKVGSDIEPNDYEGKTMRLNQVSAVLREDEGALKGQWKSAKYNLMNVTHGENGLMTFGSIGDTGLENMCYELTKDLDLYYVEDIQMHIKNDTGLPITFTNIAAKSIITTNHNEGLVDNDLEFWNNYAGFVYLINTHDFNQYPVYVKGYGDLEWSLASKESVGPDPACFTIPAGFDGLIKLPLSNLDRAYEDGSHRISKGIGLTILTGKPGTDIEPSAYSGKSLTINELRATVDPRADLYPVPAAPTGLTSTRCTTSANNDGTISGVNDTMEYRLSGGSWTSVSSGATTATGLTNGVYEVRVKQNGAYPAGNSASIKVGAWVNPDLKAYVKVIEDFESVEDLYNHIRGVEYTFMAGDSWMLTENDTNESVAAKQMLFGTSVGLQKTYVLKEVGSLAGVEYVQFYLDWDGETDLCFDFCVGASMSTPSWYTWMENHFSSWTGEYDPSKFWFDYIMNKGNTGALVSVSDSIKEAYYQDADGEWVEAAVAGEGAIIPAGYRGFVRYPVPADKRLDDVPFGFGWTLTDRTKGDLEGSMIVDDFSLVKMSTEPVEGYITFDEYLEIKGTGFEPISEPDDDDDDDDDESPAASTPSAVESTEESKPAEDKPAKKKGCKSMACAGAALVVVASLAGGALMLRKKED